MACIVAHGCIETQRQSKHDSKGSLVVVWVKFAIYMDRCERLKESSGRIPKATERLNETCRETMVEHE